MIGTAELQAVTPSVSHVSRSAVDRTAHRGDCVLLPAPDVIPIHMDANDNPHRSTRVVAAHLDDNDTFWSAQARTAPEFARHTRRLGPPHMTARTAKHDGSARQR